MSRPKPKRTKAYRPCPQKLPMTIRFDSDDERALQLIPHTSLKALADGVAEEADWHTLACRLNVGYTLAKDYFSEEASGALKTALYAIREVRDRHERVGKWGATPDELARIGDGLVITDDAQKACTRRELRNVMVHVFKQATEENKRLRA